MVELGRIDIAVEVSMLSSQLALPRDGHLEALYRIFAYLKCHHNSRIVFDPTYPEINESDFKDQDWSTFYGNVKEVRPENAPVPRGKGFIITGYVDADHAGEGYIDMLACPGEMQNWDAHPMVVRARKF